MSQMAASMAGDRLFAGAQQPIAPLVGLFAGTCALLWSVCHSWLAALMYGASFQIDADTATFLWLDYKAFDYALMALLLAALGRLIHDDGLVKRRVRAWQRRACRDPLTGVANRRALDQYLRGVMRDRRGAKRFVALIIDLDDFKQLNDQHGHQVGDEALRQVAVIVKDHFKRREDPLIARWGGDEFVVLLPYVSQSYTEKLCLKLAAKLRRVSLQTINPKIFFGASVGYATGVSENQRDFKHLFEAADLTLLDVKKKRHPKNRVKKDISKGRPLQDLRAIRK